MIGRGALIMGSIDDALARSVMMTDERKKYLAERWAHWAEQQRRKRDDPAGLHPVEMLRE